MLEIPLFIVDGFLDSGKSSFIVDAIEKDGFSKNGRTLIILCEEGEVEITEDFVKKWICGLFKLYLVLRKSF